MLPPDTKPPTLPDEEWLPPWFPNAVRIVAGVYFVILGVTGAPVTDPLVTWLAIAFACFFSVSRHAD
jgi:hypothetical protein